VREVHRGLASFLSSLAALGKVEVSNAKNTHQRTLPSPLTGEDEKFEKKRGGR
jgi:hypothetical protein